MKIAAFSCIDNQAESKYPIDYIYRQLDWVDRKYLFVPNAEQAALLPRTGSTVIENGVRITSPEHIGAAQNEAVKWLKQNDDADFFMLVQATKLPLPECKPQVLDFVKESNRHTAFKYGCGYVRMYCKAYIGMFGTVVIGRNCPDRFDPNGDGAPSSFPSQEEPATSNWKINRPNRVLDIGYFSTEMAARHTLQNAKLWKRSQDWIQSAEAFFRGDRDQFVLKLFREVKEYNHGHLDILNLDTDPIARKIVDDLGLQEDYRYAVGLAHQVGATLL